MRRRGTLGLLATMLAGALSIFAQPAGADTPPVPVESAPSDEDLAEGGTSYSVSAFAYFVPEGSDFVQPTFAVDRGRLHLEARYNYEALETASLWAGRSFSGGERPAWEITPLLGVVFGDVSGIAPGYQGSLGGWKLELYSEGEYVFDTTDSAESFFYNWSELSFLPGDRFRVGIVAQRTRAYETGRDMQRGVLAGGSFRRLDVSAYVFNPDDGDPVWVVAAELGF
jgi:hypothetical protein